ncbi:MAG TPA: methylated-DNA--[protein]-cysteine S-methyltransferase [Kiloniellaceae bacterium]|nr:methylated-DNA--[protein]-cysteine S-methyltransferase [Kiloniellaceae bacterium]
MTLVAQCTLETAFGSLVVTERDGALVRLTWGHGKQDDTPLLREAVRQLQAYEAGRLTVFDLPLATAGTAFQQSVWVEMRRIPYGRTKSYGDLAAALGSVARAVGGTCGLNPIPIVIPCHRVIASDGSLGGFSGGAGRDSKRALLLHEGALQEQPRLI